MARPRRRFCPHGHDKDAPGGSYNTVQYTVKGTLVFRRNCAMCDKLAHRKGKGSYEKEKGN